LRIVNSVSDHGQGIERADSRYLQSDEPISRRSEDRLDRARLADAIASQVIQSLPGQGFVIAVDGPWGSGKTSVLNMIEESALEQSELVILRFNPWLFSGTEQLVVRFLQELSVQLGERADEMDDQRLRAIGERLAAYGEVLVPLVWVPVVGPWLGRFGSLARVLGKRRGRKKAPPSVFEQQQRARKALAELDRRVLVVVDDLDRVEADQIRDVVRLIKLVADFPNVTYLLAYEAEKVAQAFGDDLQTGREYLEKIVQVTHTLPEISDWPLVVLLQTELDSALQGIEYGPFSRDDWINVFHTGMRPFFENVRDVRRYLNAVPVTLRVVGREVALVDALALETLRIFAPGAYTKLPSMVSILTGESEQDWQTRSREREEANERAVSELVEAAAPHQEAARRMIQRLFPRAGGVVGGGRGYRRHRRVAHPDVLRIYLRRTLPEGTTPAQLVEQAYEVMGDRDRFTELLATLNPRELEDLLGRLEDYEQDYDPSAAEAASEVLLNQMPRLREGRQGTLDMGSELAITRVVLRLLRSVEEEKERALIVRRVLPRVEQLSGRAELIDLAGHRPNAGHGLIPQADWTELEREHNEQVLAADPIALAQERQLAGLLYRALEYEDGAHRSRVSELCEDNGVLLRLLRSAYSERKAQTMGDLAVQTTPSLPWEWLVEIAGSETRLRERIAELRASVNTEDLDQRTRAALETAERYASGELPSPDDRY
jgi:hypothetical protein